MEEAGVALREPKVCRNDLAYAVHAEPHLHRLILAAKVRGPKRCGGKVRRRLRAESDVLRPQSDGYASTIHKPSDPQRRKPPGDRVTIDRHGLVTHLSFEQRHRRTADQLTYTPVQVSQLTLQRSPKFEIKRT